MKITDRMVLRDKRVEKKIRALEVEVDKLQARAALSQDNFVAIQSISLELFITAFKRFEDNTTPGKTLMDFTGREVQHACNCVGPSRVFEEDRDFVIAVMQELTK
jgi:hypothetical protein